MLPDIVKRVDTETYGLFRAIVLDQGNEWEEAFSDASQEDRLTVKDIASHFFDVNLRLSVRLIVDFQRL